MYNLFGLFSCVLLPSAIVLIYCSVKKKDLKRKNVWMSVCAISLVACVIIYNTPQYQQENADHKTAEQAEKNEKLQSTNNNSKNSSISNNGNKTNNVLDESNTSSSGSNKDVKEDDSLPEGWSKFDDDKGAQFARYFCDLLNQNMENLGSIVKTEQSNSTTVNIFIPNDMKYVGNAALQETADNMLNLKNSQFPMWANDNKIDYDDKPVLNIWSYDYTELASEGFFSGNMKLKYKL